jgi:4-carboxymuconolactone decarboxylase
MEIRRQVLGNPHVDRATANTTALTAEFQDLITRYAWGEIWTRPGLDVRTRRVLVLGTLVALGRFDEFRMHARAALNEGGFSENDLKEIVLQQAIYCGVPAANTAFEMLREVVGVK